MLIAHVSDIHLGGRVDAAERTAHVLAHLDGLRREPDAVLITGDLADHGAEPEYEQLRELLADRPVLLCPGNHDVREAYRKVLLDEPPSGDAINTVADRGGARFVMLDSSIPGRDDGRLDDDTLAFLRDVLADTPAGRPVFVAFHHPAVELAVPFIDNIRLGEPHRLAEILDGHPNVVAVLCGHAHVPAATTFAGRPLLVAPGVTSILGLPWETEEIVDYDQPPALAYHVLDGGRLTTHYRALA